VAAVSALVVSEINATVPVANGTTYLKLVLKNGTLTDISKHVSTSTGFLSTKLPSSKSGRYRLFIFYQRRTHNHNIVAPESVTKTIFDNGSFTVDHFSARGAQTVTKFWEQHILIDGLKELLQEVGDCGESYQSSLLCTKSSDSSVKVGKIAWSFGRTFHGRQLCRQGSRESWAIVLSRSYRSSSSVITTSTCKEARPEPFKSFLTSRTKVLVTLTIIEWPWHMGTRSI
jgi:hypothetical protein